MIVTRTPLRISFAGGGTDFPDFYTQYPGHVVSSSIDRYVYVVLKERFDDLIIVGYSKREEVTCIDDLEHELVREAMRKTGVTKGVEISSTFGRDTVHGGGLGFLSSLTVGLLNALYLYQGVKASPGRLAREACEVEIGACNKPIGKQDQYIAAYGGLKSFRFHTRGLVTIERVGIHKTERRRLSENLLLFYTGIGRKSESILHEQRSNIPKKMELLRFLAAFADLALSELSSLEFDKIGLILDRTWDIKKRLASGISNSVIDDLYQKGLDAGALGGKLCGAGGGGHLLLYVPKSRQAAVREAFSGELQEVPFSLSTRESEVIVNTIDSTQ